MRIWLDADTIDEDGRRDPVIRVGPFRVDYLCWMAVALVDDIFPGDPDPDLVNSEFVMTRERVIRIVRDHSLRYPRCSEEFNLLRAMLRYVIAAPDATTFVFNIA